MFEWIVMGFFIGVPVLMVLGALVAWMHQRKQDFSIEDLDSSAAPRDIDMSGGSTA